MFRTPPPLRFTPSPPSKPVKINILPQQPGLLTYDPHFIPRDEADRLFEELLRDTPWQEETLTMYGKPYKVPRLISWHGDRDYTYSHTRHIANAWTAPLRGLQQRAEAEAGTKFNSVLLNLYRNGQDSVSWHADDENDLGPAPIIASLSLGAARDFKLRPKQKTNDGTDRKSFSLKLEHGSCLVMGAGLQSTWEHAIPKTNKPLAPRINLTFRWIG